MSIQSLRSCNSFLILVLLSFIAGAFGQAASAQNLKDLDLAVNGFAQTTGSETVDGVQDSPSKSGGALISARESLRPWLGYEVNYSYTRFSEGVAGRAFAVQNNVHEATGAYLVEGPKFLGLQPFGTAGAGGLIFLPTASGGQYYNMQTKLAFLYELGVNYPILTAHLGLRLEYRGLLYKTPNYVLTSGSDPMRQTSEVAVGAYFHF